MGMHNRHGSIEIEVTVKRDELLSRLRQNREKHADEFNQAIAAWQTELRTALSSMPFLRPWPFRTSFNNYRAIARSHTSTNTIRQSACSACA